MRTLFDGPDVTAADAVRLEGQLGRVFELMRDGQWRTLAEIAGIVKGSEAGVSARLRDLRKRRFNSNVVERRRATGALGLWEYRLIPRASASPVGRLPQEHNATESMTSTESGARGVSNV